MEEKIDVTLIKKIASEVAVGIEDRIASTLVSSIQEQIDPLYKDQLDNFKVHISYMELILEQINNFRVLGFPIGLYIMGKSIQRVKGIQKNIIEGKNRKEKDGNKKDQ